MDAFERGLPWKQTPHYVIGQVLGGITGAIVAHLMFGLPLVSFSRHARSGPPQVFSEFVATFGLVSVIWGCSRLRSNAVPFAVGAYITAAYWFTASTSFANPAVTIARCLATHSRASAPTMSRGSSWLSFSEGLRRRWFFAGLFLIYRFGPRKSSFLSTSSGTIRFTVIQSSTEPD